jgi:hypothetical protein
VSSVNSTVHLSSVNSTVHLQSVNSTVHLQSLNSIVHLLTAQCICNLLTAQCICNLLTAQCICNLLTAQHSTVYLQHSYITCENTFMSFLVQHFQWPFCVTWGIMGNNYIFKKCIIFKHHLKLNKMFNFLGRPSSLSDPKYKPHEH